MEGLLSNVRLYVLSLLDLRSLLTSGRVNNEWHRFLHAAAADVLWKQHAERMLRTSGDVSDEKPFIVTINGLERTTPGTEDLRVEPSKKFKSGLASSGSSQYIRCRQVYRERILCGAFFDELNFYPVVNDSQVQSMKSWEIANGVKLPDSVFHFLKRNDIESLVTHSYPTNNYLDTIGGWHLKHWESGHLSLLVLNENQGCCFWHIKWRQYEDIADPPVYVVTQEWSEEDQEPEDKFELDNPHFSDFWKLMAKDGMKWYQENPGYQKDFGESGPVF